MVHGEHDAQPVGLDLCEMPDDPDEAHRGWWDGTTSELLGVQACELQQSGVAVQVEPVVEDGSFPTGHGPVGPCVLPLGDDRGGRAGATHDGDFATSSLPSPSVLRELVTTLGRRLLPRSAPGDAVPLAKRQPWINDRSSRRIYFHREPVTVICDGKRPVADALFAR